jgi:hypothetical protein
MALAPDLRPAQRGWLCSLCVGVLLTACDLTPVLGDGRSPDRQRQPVETVTALEIDAADLRVGDPAASAGRDTLPGAPDAESR